MNNPLDRLRHIGSDVVLEDIQVRTFEHSAVPMTRNSGSTRGAGWWPSETWRRRLQSDPPLIPRIPSIVISHRAMAIQGFHSENVTTSGDSNEKLVQGAALSVDLSESALRDKVYDRTSFLV